MQIENCAICRNHLMEPCIECQPNAMGNIPSEECIPAWEYVIMHFIYIVLEDG